MRTSKKFFFTLIDFRGATSHFSDRDFDGDPVQIYEPGDGDPIAPPDDAPQDDNTISPTPGADETVVDQLGLPLPSGDPVRKIYVDGVGARIIAERVEYLDENGKLVTESLRDFTKTALKKRFASLDDFLKRWKSAERKQAIIEELEEEGLALDAVADELGKHLDPFDLICHIAFDRKPLTRRERAENVKKHDAFTKYGPQARTVLDALLEKYCDDGVLNLDDTAVLKVTPFTSMGSVMQLIKCVRRKGAFEKGRPRNAGRALSGDRLMNVQTESFGRTIKLFLVDGAPNGLIIASIHGWTGSVLVANQAAFDKLAARPEADRTGLYILFGPDPKDVLATRAYIGEADCVKDRINQSAQEREFWETAVIITASDEALTKGDVRYLEARLINAAREAGRVKLDNGQSPEVRAPTLAGGRACQHGSVPFEFARDPTCGGAGSVEGLAPNRVTSSPSQSKGRTKVRTSA